MVAFPQPMQRLVACLSKLPSLGEKSASRLAYFMLNGNRDLAQALAAAIQDAVQQVKFCERCYFLSDQSLCGICRSGDRDPALICVVEKPMDVIAIERVGEFRGLYHVLQGLWAPLRGVGPEQIKLKELLSRLEDGTVREVILATNVTVEGDATAMYIANMLAERGIKATRLAQGMPKGGELEFADDLTLSRAFSGRNVLECVTK